MADKYYIKEIISSRKKVSYGVYSVHEIYGEQLIWSAETRNNAQITCDLCNALPELPKEKK